ncbi:MAG: DNA-3-methyladenine glycosylase I [Nitrospirales bacterium]|nr:DNA-3-methyladenine glycosylase I [Nitrospirales bacterium]
MGRKSPIKIQEVIRCGWVGTKPHFISYHDEEWGIPVHEDRRHFEMLILEGAQAGLSWSTILLRREGYRRAFAGFDPLKVSKFDARKKAALIQDSGIIRNRLKIESAITNARAFLTVQEEFGTFDHYIWKFVGGTPKLNNWKAMSQVPATTAESDALSKDLKRRGFKFVGSTVIYAHMQATGLVNDHTTDCFRHPSNLSSHSTLQRSTFRRTQSSLAIRVKRVYDPPDTEDGFRILIDRLWPRGLSKDSANVDLWQKDLAPTTGLRNWFQHDPSRWKEFQARYATELDQNIKAVEELWQRTRQSPVTILFAAKNETYNNAVALKEYLHRHFG